MIILDTNIISELIRAAPDQKVTNWFERQDPQRLTTTAITLAELRFGVHSMAPGKRQTMLDNAISEMLEEDFEGNILPFDTRAAEAFGILAARLKGLGTPVGHNDTMIAAIALAHDAMLVTRNDRHFKRCGISVVNPYEA